MRITKTAIVTNNKLKRSVFFILGTLAFFTGFIGLIIPGLPTTIFMIIAGYFYFYSSNKFYNYIINHKLFGTHVYNFLTGNGITLKGKKVSIISMWIFISLGIILGFNSFPQLIIAFILILGMSGTFFILKQPTYK
jgi:uncharacterized protein